MRNKQIEPRLVARLINFAWVLAFRKSNPNNVEARLIRLSIQENTPKLLKYKANIDADKKQILLLFDKQSSDLKEYIKNYVKQSKIFTEAEKQQLNK